jgi:hypothetical protein
MPERGRASVPSRFMHPLIRAPLQGESNGSDGSAILFDGPLEENGGDPDCR